MITAFERGSDVVPDADALGLLDDSEPCAVHDDSAIVAIAIEAISPAELGCLIRLSARATKSPCYALIRARSS